MSDRTTRRPAALLGVALSAALAAVGCVPSVEQETANYRELLDPDGSAQAQSLPEGRLDLATVLRLAVAHDERLAVSGEDYLQALIDRDRQYAGFLPAISFGVNHFRQDEFALPGSAGSSTGSSSAGSGVSSIAPLTTTDLPFTFSMNLFNGFRDYNAVRRAFAETDNREALLANLRADVLLETADVYYRVLLGETRQRVLSDNLALQERRLRDIREREQAGTARPLDVAEAESDVAEVRVQLVDARRDVRNARALLAFLIGTAVVENPLTDSVPVPEAQPEPEELLRIALGQRDDLRAAHARVQLAEKQVHIAWGGYLPVGSIDFNLYALKQSFPQEILWDVALRASQPIFAGGLIRADIRAANSRLRQAQLTAERLQRQIRQELTTAASELRASRERVMELEAVQRSAAEAYRISSERYREGFATNLEVRTAQNQQLAAEVRLETAKLDTKVQYLRLLRLRGDFPSQPFGLSAGRPR